MDQINLLSIPQEPINRALKEHIEETGTWTHHDLANVLHEWVNRFNSTFSLGLDTPAIQIERAHVRNLGSYRRDRNGFGLRHELTLNTKHLYRSLAEILETLLHELLHEWQELYGTAGVRNYHNRQFRTKARSYGLVTDERGYCLGVARGSFTELLAQHEIDITTLPPPPKESESEQGISPRLSFVGASKLKKWSCGCTNIRAAVTVEARCLQCGNLFRPAPPAW